MPVINGIRITLSALLGQIAEGGARDGLLAGYPELRKAAIQTASSLIP